MLAESKIAIYDLTRIVVLQQARTHLDTSPENDRNTAWESAWIELEKSLCEPQVDEVMGGRP